jgi:hypothetical protein
MDGEWIASKSNDFTEGYVAGAAAQDDSWRGWLECHGYGGPFPSDLAETIYKETHCECHAPKSLSREH